MSLHRIALTGHSLRVHVAFFAVALMCTFVCMNLSTRVMAQAAQAPAGPVPATPANAAAFIGDWNVDASGPNGPQAITLTFKVVEGKVVGEIEIAGAAAKQTVSDVTKSATGLVLSYDFDYQGMPVPVVVTVTSGEKVGVQVDFAGGAYQLAGTATKKPAKP